MPGSVTAVETRFPALGKYQVKAGECDISDRPVSRVIARREASPNLDVLRSLAVLTVMIDHLVPTLVARGLAVPAWLVEITAHIGQAGVLAFFVHTSLVLMYSLGRMSSHHQGLPLIGRFYVRRAFRIYPLAVACIALVLLFRVPAMTWRPTPAVTGPVIAANLLLVQNLWTRQSVLGPLWSLPYELQMYVALPVLFLVGAPRFERRRS